MERSYLCIDLKSFYASVECMERGLDPMTTLLAVADETRTDKTICLAVSPALKAYGISGRARLFEARQQVRLANAQRLRQAPGGCFAGKSSNALELAANPGLEIDFIAAPPQMGKYMETSATIYNVYICLSAELEKANDRSLFLILLFYKYLFAIQDIESLCGVRHTAPL